MRRISFASITLVALTVVIGWVFFVGPIVGYHCVMDDGKKNNPFVKDFYRLFPKAASSISYYTGDFGPTQWQSKAPAFGRYVLTMHMQITLDDGRKAIEKYDEPTFSLVEITGIRTDDGRTSIYQDGLSLLFGVNEWKKLVDADGDLLKLGQSLKKHQPVDGFDEYWNKEQALLLR